MRCDEVIAQNRTLLFSYEDIDMDDDEFNLIAIT
jgi:hypothetical protein